MKNKYTVENVPFYLKPFFWLYGYGLGGSIFLLMKLLHYSLRIKREGAYDVVKDKNVIYSFWHQDLVGFYSCVPSLKNFEMINHPIWFMKPIHVLSKSLGMHKIYYGSTGHGGKLAAQNLAKAIANGRSTFITPDGPIGPAQKLNKGVLHLSKDSGQPIVVLQYHFGTSFKLGGWDQKIFPLPFSTITINYSEPFQVTEENFEEAEGMLKNMMSD